VCVGLGLDIMTKEIQKVNAVLDFKVPFNPFSINESISITWWFTLLDGKNIAILDSWAWEMLHSGLLIFFLKT
jgi:hypothetical protein